MSDRIRFHLDENVNPAIAGALRQKGIDVTTCRESGLLGKTDQEQLAFAMREMRVIVTHDDDFLRLADSGYSHAGIVYCQQKSLSIGEIIAGLVLILEILSPSEILGKVEFL
jgi:predicted nuclease of predicted toxin-antitoxin system